jgi:Fe-S cluster biogenesis protein NfuA
VEDIKITAEPALNGASCKFVVDRPIYAEGAAYFNTKEAAAGSPLAKRIFELLPAKSVLISGGSVTVTAGPLDDWRPAAKNVALAIRDQLHSGRPAVDPKLQEQTAGKEADIRRRVEEVLETKINPAIAAHGGTISILDVKGNTVYLEMSGGCQGCASSTATLRLGVDSAIRDAVPEVGEILDTTDHAAGRNPYYAPH